MASLVCLDCKEILGTLHKEQITGEALDDNDHHFVTIAAGNIIEGIEAKA